MLGARTNDLGFVLRYGGVAAGCALLHNGIVIGAAYAGAGIFGAAAISFCLMVVIGYLLLCRVAFGTVPTRSSFTRYTVAMACNFPITTGLLWILVEPLHVPVTIAAPVVTLLMAGINLLSSRWAILRRKTPCAS